MHFTIDTLPALEAVSARDWDALVPADQPFLRHAFLHALEASGAVTPAAGWTPAHLVVRREGALVAALPRYRKVHSFGEYVFDWAWADAWERAGGDYYPKGLTAVPFTPAPGARLLIAPGVSRRAVIAELAAACCDASLSSWHLLFAESEEVDDWLAVRPDLLERASVQFQWRDAGYGDFAGFLAAMSAKRRKEVRRERRRVAEQGLEMVRLEGEAIDAAALEHFYRCYRITYHERGQQPYLSRDFFRRLRATMPETLLLVQARHGGRPVAAALCVQGSDTLYGRYWGSEVEADCLHFEACYYQGIEHCLEKRLTRFDPGTQGEHKVSRGFAPRRLRSLHYIAHPGFRDAVARFCAEEREHIAAYQHHVEARLPFRRDRDDAAG